jgi:hypothetical protein
MRSSPRIETSGSGLDPVGGAGRRHIAAPKSPRSPANIPLPFGVYHVNKANEWS